MAFIPSVENDHPQERGAWDGAAAVRRLRTWQGAKGVARAAAVVRGNFSSLQAIPDDAPLSGPDGVNALAPHHDYVGGRYSLHRAGVIAALVALRGGRTEPDVSAELKAAGLRHLLAHAKVFDLPSAEEAEARAAAQELGLNYDLLGPGGRHWLGSSHPSLLQVSTDPYAGAGDPALRPRFTESRISPWLVLLTEGLVNASGEGFEVSAAQIDHLALTPIDPEKNDLFGSINHASLNRKVLDPNGAVGYIRALKAATRPEDGLRVLLAKVEWTAYGIRLIETGAFTRLSFESDSNLTEIIGFGLVDRAGDPDSDLARVARAAPVKEDLMPQVQSAPAPVPAPEDQAVVTQGDQPRPVDQPVTASPGPLAPVVAGPVPAEPSAEVLAARAEADSLKARLEKLETERRHDQHERFVSDLVLSKAGESRLDPKFQGRAVALLDALAPAPQPITGRAGGDAPTDSYAAFRAFLSALPARQLKASGQTIPENEVAAAIQHGADVAEARSAAAKMGRSGEAVTAYVQTYLRQKGYSAQAAEELSKGVN